MSEHFYDRNSLIASQIAFPIHCDEHGEYLFDADGNMVMEVRGWGRLSKRGPDFATTAMKEIGDAFADAFNKEYGP